jgi:WD40 repeat protein
VLWHTITNKKTYIWSKRNGYCACSANYNVGLIAAAEYGIKPEVHIYRRADRELVSTFPLDTTVKCIGMAFSRSGKYLIMIGGVPDFRISLYDIEHNKKLVIPETKLPCKADEFLSVKFNPKNNMQFCILSQTVVYTFTIHQAYDVNQRGEQQFLGESSRLESTEYRDENPDLTFIQFVWDPYGRIHICTDQAMVIQVDPKYNKLENCLNLTHRAACCLMT